MLYRVDETTIEHDEEGYLFEKDFEKWTPELGLVIANKENIEMSDEHWMAIFFLRDYYDEYQIPAAIRVLVKALREKLGEEKGTNQYLYELFPYGLKQACKVAGLEKPSYCI